MEALHASHEEEVSDAKVTINTINTIKQRINKNKA